MCDIHRGTLEDKEQLLQLYNNCFIDDEEFAHFFFEEIWNPDQTLLIRRNSKVISSLQMLPLQFSKEKVQLSGFYIFAVCTEPEYRGRGYAGKLIEKCFESAKNLGADFCALIVQEASLLNYYERFGFKSLLHVTKKEGLAEYGKVESLDVKDVPAIAELYRRHTACMVSAIRDEEHWNQQMRTYKAFGQKNNGKLENYCFVDIRDDELCGIEAMGDNACMACSYAAYQQGFGKYTVFTLPSDESVPIGCIKAFSENCKLLFRDNAKGYLNLYFN